MSFTYTGNPADSDRDAVRFLMGDTSSVDYSVEDAEIAWALTQEPDLYFAAALCCDAVAAKYAAEVASATMAETSVAYADRQRRWQSQAETLRNSRRQNLPYAWAGGWKTSEKDAFAADTDREELAVTKGFMANTVG